MAHLGAQLALQDDPMIRRRVRQPADNQGRDIQRGAVAHVLQLESAHGIHIPIPFAVTTGSRPESCTSSADPGGLGYDPRPGNPVGTDYRCVPSSPIHGLHIQRSLKDYSIGRHSGRKIELDQNRHLIVGTQCQTPFPCVIDVRLSRI